MKKKSEQSNYIPLTLPERPWPVEIAVAKGGMGSEITVTRLLGISDSIWEEL